MAEERAGGAGVELADVLAALRHIVGDLDGYLERRAAEMAAPRIAEAEADAQRRIGEKGQELERERDLTAEMRRQIIALVKMSDGLRARLDEAGVRGLAVRQRADDDRAALRELLGSIWLYVDWRYVTKQLTTEQKEMWADAVDAFGEPETGKAERWWRDDYVEERG